MAQISLAFTLMETSHISETLGLSDRIIDSRSDLAEGYNLQGFGLTQQARILKPSRLLERPCV